MAFDMKSLLSRIGPAAARADEPQLESRREQIVRRQREQIAAEVQSRLSRQQTDAPPEEAAQPLYDPSAYSTRHADN